MRIAPRSTPAVQPRFTPAPARASGSTRAAVDSFAPAPATTKKVVAEAAKKALGNVAETALTSVLSKVLDVITTRLASLLDGLLAKLTGAGKPASALPPAAPPQVSPASPAAPAAPVAPGGLAPTPLAKDVPNQVAYVNTIQEPRIAPKSSFREVVDQAIDAVRAKGAGIDPQEADRITNYDAYHHGVVMELRARGYNANYDGEELAVGRPNDSFSEQFDISTSTGLVRRFYAAWVSPPVWG